MRTEPWDWTSIESETPRRGARNSPPNVARVVVNVVFLQKGDELSLKIALSMMLILARDVRKRSANLSLSNGKRPMAFLPCEAFNAADFVHPVRRHAFDFPHRGSYRHGRRQRQEKMDVVLSSPDCECRHSVVARNATHVGPQARLDLPSDALVALLGGEDTMHERATIGV